MKINNRRAIMQPLNTGIHKDHDFIEVTEWTNGEGWDVTLSDRSFSLHYTEFRMLKKIIKHLEKGDDD
jgi:hypothetical protein